jgi:hypothetical protein
MGENMKFEMVMESVDVDPPDEPEADGDFEPVPPQAARSRAPDRIRTPAPLLNRVGIFVPTALGWSG